LQRRALGLRNAFQIQESLTNTSFVTVDQFIGGRIDTLHTRNKDEVARARANAPGVAPSATVTAPGGVSVLTPLGDDD
jgi:hypothetical protein